MKDAHDLIVEMYLAKRARRATRINREYGKIRGAEIEARKAVAAVWRYGRKHADCRLTEKDGNK